jgi:hypothetical protein
MCNKDNNIKQVKNRTVDDHNKLNKQIYAENYIVVQLWDKYYPAKILDGVALYVKPYDKLMDDLENSIKISMDRVPDPYGTVDDADSASRDRYYFKQGMKEAFNILLNREFDFEEFKKNHPYEVSRFANAISCMRGALRVGDEVLKQDLKRMIERL